MVLQRGNMQTILLLLLLLTEEYQVFGVLWGKHLHQDLALIQEQELFLEMTVSFQL